MSYEVHNRHKKAQRIGGVHAAKQFKNPLLVGKWNKSYFREECNIPKIYVTIPMVTTKRIINVQLKS